MTGRIEKLKKMQRSERASISIERLILATEAYQKYAGEPVWIFRAHVLEYVLDHKKIVIRDGELLLGSATEKLRSSLIFPEYNSSLLWLKEQIPTMPTRPTDPLSLTEEEIRIAREFDKRMLQTLIAFCKAGQPINIDQGAMAGSTGPCTYAGDIAMGNAEVLAGIALSQMVRPGTSVMYGSTASGIDMRNAAVAIGAPGAAICFKYATLLAKYYNLPCRGGGVLSDAKKPDLQAGFESMMTYKTCADNKMNFIIHTAGVLDGFASASYEKLIMDFEIIDFVNRVNKEFEINEDTLAFESIEEVGHGGNFLVTEHTAEYSRQEQIIANLSVRGNADPDQLEKNIQKRIDGLYKAYQKPERDEAVLEKMRNIMLANGVSKELIEQIDSL